MEPELNINDLWKVWQWDEKVIYCSIGFLLTSSLNLFSLFNYCLIWDFLSSSVDPAENPQTEPETPVPEDAGIPV